MLFIFYTFFETVLGIGDSGNEIYYTLHNYY
jgi:hypothetical protein